MCLRANGTGKALRRPIHHNDSYNNLFSYYIMNISYSWLKEYLKFDLSPEEVSAALTSLGLETGGVEKVESVKGGLAGLVVGKVLTCTEHPDSDHLHVTTVDLGDGNATQIVCGAPNVAAGQTVVVATIGTVLYDGDKEFTIKKSKIRGVESFGMICAEDEIGVGHSHAGIIELDSKWDAGTPAREVFDIYEDYVLEVDLTPNRIDAASHLGVARDLAAWMRRHGMEANLQRPSIDAFAIDRNDGAIAVEVESKTGAPRYSGLTIRNVTVKESPEWLKNYLSAIGQRPINNIVDITNFILFSLCQPLHCFDLAKVKGGRIVVRNANQGDKFITLDGVERTLDAADVMICNAEEPMCIAGVFGGLDSGVTEATTDIFLESACFNPTMIRKTARRQGLNTDASFRFERGVDPNGTVYALKLAALLVKELAGGEICGPLFDEYPEPVAPFAVELAYSYVDGLIGKHIEPEMVKSILTSLEIGITAETADTLQLAVPTYRVDVQRPCDVVEELLRVYGYNNVEFDTTIHSSLSQKGITDHKNKLQNLISEQLVGLGFNEILNNSLTAESYYADSEAYPLSRCVKLLNPLSNDLSVMRQTLLYGGLESIAHNINRKRASLRFFEFGDCYFFDADAKADDNDLAQFSEHTNFGLWITGNKAEGTWTGANTKETIYDLKGIVENILRRTGLTDNALVVKQYSNETFSAALEYANRGGKVIANLGVVKRAVLKKFDIEQDVFFCEINWDTLVRLDARNRISYSDLPKTQPVKRDLALLIDKEVTFADVNRVVRSAERRLLRSVELFDVYEGKNLEAGKKSYAISMTLQDADKTLQDKDIEKSMSKIVATLQKELGASLR